jgi:hypothetical protein
LRGSSIRRADRERGETEATAKIQLAEVHFPASPFPRERVRQLCSMIRSGANPEVSKLSGQEIRHGERIVSAKELRENAKECLDWARTARSDRERAIFLQMAET